MRRRSESDVEIAPAIDIAAERLATAARAEAVVLFGSRPHGDHCASSDWDLCAIVPDDVRSGEVTALTLWPLVADLGLPIQVFPVTRSAVLRRRRDVNSVSHDVERDGVVL